jgi:2,3-bisphosphoglycerate-independent phosphoglycerate mutase
MSKPVPKILFIILDGAADAGKGTPLEAASTPSLDMLAKNSYCGIWTGPAAEKGYNLKSLSEIGTLELLGYGFEESPGRGLLEALGIGIEPKKGAVYLRANFATVSKDLSIADRRAGRDDTGLDELSKALAMEIDGVKIRFYRSLGHRGVLELSGSGLSRDVDDSDIGGVKPAVVHAHSKEGAKTAYILNEFLKKAHDILSRHPVNRKRKVPANHLLVRGAGQKKSVEPFEKRFGMKGCAVAADGLVKGAARYVGMHVVEVEGATGDTSTDLKAKVEAAIGELEGHGFVLLHIKGADVCSYAKDFEAKKKFLERVDAEVFARLLRRKYFHIAVTCDHVTNTATGEHEFGPVPYLIYIAGDGNNNIPRFTEAHCSRGFVTRNPMEKFMLACCVPEHHKVI